MEPVKFCHDHASVMRKEEKEEEAVGGGGGQKKKEKERKDWLIRIEIINLERTNLLTRTTPPLRKHTHKIGTEQYSCGTRRMQNVLRYRL